MTGAGPPRLTAAELDRFIGGSSDTAELRAYLEAAAVLAAFDPARMRPVGADGATVPALPDGLLARSEPITQGPDAGLWSLALPDRRAALRRLVRRGAVPGALAANPERLGTPLQRMFEKLVMAPDTLSDLNSGLSREELGALLTAYEWVEDICPGLPARAEIERALTRFDLLAPMRRLTETGFVGRSRELERLGRYVFGPAPSAPLFVHGPGGVGKSTLVAQFVLDNIVPHNLAIAYLDLDRPTIRPDQPATILLHALTQLGPQLDLPAGATEALAKELSYSIGRVDPDRPHESSASSRTGPLLDRFAKLIEPALRHSVVLIVVDTFEEAQYLGIDVVLPLLSFLARLARLRPGPRLILSGRALPDEFVSPERPINLGNLDHRAARTLLRRSLTAAGLATLRTDELDDVIGVVSRNAMCLKLAARLLRDEGVDQLRASRSEFLTRLKAEKIQALLYGRILRHLHTDDARAVAYPGLVVRRIAPDVIREVLAGPCKLDLRPGHDEYAVFNELRTEAALVEIDPEDGSLRHRADVRRSVLEDLTDHVPPDTIESIDHAAVDFYEARSGAIARTEEIYHRMRLCQPSEMLEARWSPEAAARLKNAGDEVPAVQRLWLARKLGVTLDPSARRAASQEMWEEEAATSAERFLLADAPEQALGVLRERSERLPRSKLYHAEAEAYRLLGRPQDALAVARTGVDAASRAGAVDLTLELLLKMVVIEEGRDHLDPAMRLLEEAATVAEHSSNPLLRFRVTITKLRLLRRLSPDARFELPALHVGAAAEVTEDLIRMLRSHPVLLREAAAELGHFDAHLTSTAMVTLGVEVADDAQAQAFGHAIVNATESSSIPLEVAFTEGAQRFQVTDFNAEEIRQWITTVVQGRDTRTLSRSLAEAESGTDVLGDFQDYFRAGVDNSLRSPAEGDAGPAQ